MFLGLACAVPGVAGYLEVPKDNKDKLQYGVLRTEVQLANANTGRAYTSSLSPNTERCHSINLLLPCWRE